MRENPFQAFPLASGGLLATFGVRGLSKHHPSLPSSSQGVLSVCMSVYKCSLFYKNTSHLGLGVQPTTV